MVGHLCLPYMCLLTWRVFPKSIHKVASAQLTYCSGQFNIECLPRKFSRSYCFVFTYCMLQRLIKACKQGQFITFIRTKSYYTLHIHTNAGATSPSPSPSTWPWVEHPQDQPAPARLRPPKTLGGPLGPWSMCSTALNRWTTRSVQHSICWCTWAIEH